MCLGERHRNVGAPCVHPLYQRARIPQAGLGTRQPASPVIDFGGEQEIVELVEGLPGRGVKAQRFPKGSVGARGVTQPEMGVSGVAKDAAKIRLQPALAHLGLGSVEVSQGAAVVADPEVQASDQPLEVSFFLTEPKSSGDRK
jgi:hypothetical protein